MQSPTQYEIRPPSTPPTRRSRWALITTVLVISVGVVMGAFLLRNDQATDQESLSPDATVDGDWSRVPHDPDVFGLPGQAIYDVSTGGPGLVAVGKTVDRSVVLTVGDEGDVSGGRVDLGGWDRLVPGSIHRSFDHPDGRCDGWRARIGCCWRRLSPKRQNSR